MNVEKYVEEIKEKLKEQGYVGRKIDYIELKTLHKMYGNQISEKAFAIYVLEISINSYNSVKKSEYKTQILKKQLEKIVEQEVEGIKQELQRQGYSGKLIDYQELQNLHQTHGKQIPEDVFAKNVLDISENSYVQLKAKKRKVYILRRLQNESIEYIQRIRKTMQTDGYVGKLIDYDELQNLRIKYGMQFSESRFAQKVLEIGESSYLSLKNHGTKVRILSSLVGTITIEELQNVREQLKKHEYVGKAISYEELKILHQTYGIQMQESEFAKKVLEITYGYYETIRNNPNKRAIIMKSLVSPKITLEELEKIKKELKSQGYVDSLIDYSDLQGLHQLYGKQMPEKEFAENVLEISLTNYNRIKNNALAKCTILKRTTKDLPIEKIKEIKEQLAKQNYVGKTIDYVELQKLHQMYASEMNEKEFANKVLEITYRQYSHMKYDSNQSVILKSLIVQVPREKVQEIKGILLSQNYARKLIDYKELQTLHQTYGQGMSESQFAQEVLEITYVTYIGFKNSSKKTRKTRILKNQNEENETSLEEIQKIKERLQMQGYGGMSINYQELQTLHQIYGEEMTEEGFARCVLELTYSQYHIIKSGKDNAKILKSLAKQQLTLEEIESIREELKRQGYTNKFIEYRELQFLHQTYGIQMTEIEFAISVLRVNETSYKEAKSYKKQKIKILGNFTLEIKSKASDLKRKSETLSQEDKERIRQLLQLDGYVGRLIDYSELQILHKTYGAQMTEVEFSQDILNITYGTYQNMKHTGSKTVILKDRSDIIEQENIDKIKRQLELEGYVGKAINYAELQTLHKRFGQQFPENKFAIAVLEIIPSQYKRMKRGLRNAIILKSYIINISCERIEEIKQDLVMQGYFRKKINYEELQKLHQIYGSEISETRFATKILGISSALLGNIRRLPKARAKILNNFGTIISEEEVNTIKELLEEKGYGGKKIDYSQFQSLYQTYGMQMQEEVFAEIILEIPYTATYKRLKEKNCSIQILCNNKKINLMRCMLFAESRWYTKEEIEQICNENEVSLDKLIRLIVSNGTNYYNEDYKRVLEENGKLWIGKTRLF